MKPFLRWCVRIVVILLVLSVAAVLMALLLVRQSLPDVDGTLRIAGLSAPVSISRDPLGVPTIEAVDREDAARALGFLHGQERFFQIDLMRRSSAGELSELFGPVALNADRRVRIHRFRAEARKVIESMEHRERRILDAYSDGVNAGVARLASRPFEYWILREKPAPWKPEDSILVAYAMWLDLQESNGEPDRSRAVVRDVFSPEAAAFLLSPADPFQSAVDGSVIVAPPLPDSPGPVPAMAATGGKAASGGSVHAASAPERLFAALFPARDPDYAVGSNAWAVAGSRTASGGALLANDMHLGFRVPHVWYRANTKVGSMSIGGVTLPGTPVFIVGSNGHVAWGFTNAEIDTADMIIVEPDPTDPSRYLTPDGPVAFEDFKESIAVKGGATEKITVRWTRWGPLIGKDHRGRTIALLWAAHQPGAADIGLMRMEDAQTVTDALRVAQESGVPHQNCIAADSNGSIGWTIAGRVPRRVGFDGTAPVSLAHGGGWDGWLAPEEVPMTVDPPDGILWGANARMVGGAALMTLGDGGYALASRAREIHDKLLVVHDAKPADMLALQLDIRAIHADFWRDLLVSTLTPEAMADNPGRAAMRKLAVEWNGDANAASAGYRLIADFRAQAMNRTTVAIFARAQTAFPDFSPYSLQYNLTRERIVRSLLTEKPAAWLPAGHPGWNSLLLGSVDAVISSAGGATALEGSTWGDYNRLNMRHPLSAVLPVVGRYLDMPRTPMNGDGNVVNALLRGHGPSERMAVTPGRESEGILEMPGGQAGNPFSPHYSDSHPDWLNGAPTPFLPGPAVNTLLLTP